jgi:hypothetical protein
MLNDEKEAAARFMQAGADLLSDAVRQTRTDDPASVRKLQQVLQAGGMARLSVTLGLAGVGWINCEVIEPDGTAHSMATLELRRRVAS